MSKAIPIVLMIASLSRPDPDEPGDPIRMITHGTLTREAGRDLLVYEERQQDEDSGEILVQEVSLEISGGRILMNRVGDFGMTLVFERGHRFEGSYHTPWGEMEMAIFTTCAEAEIGGERGSVHLHYQVELQGGLAAVNDIRLDYRRQAGANR